MSITEAPAVDDAAPPIGPDPFETFPLLGLLFAFDTSWRAYRIRHPRNEDLAALHELFRPLSAEIHRLGMVDKFTGRLSFKGDAREVFDRCLEVARGAGLQWPDIVEAVNKAGEAGK